VHCAYIKYFVYLIKILTKNFFLKTTALIFKLMKYARELSWEHSFWCLAFISIRTNCPRAGTVFLTAHSYSYSQSYSNPYSYSSCQLPAADLIETKKQSELAPAAANEVNLINAHCVLISAFDLCSTENRQSATMIMR